MGLAVFIAFALLFPLCSGMEYVDAIYDGYGEKPDQGKITRKGNEYLEKEFPLLSFISRTFSGDSPN
jgi:hypothetical protein